MWLQKPAQPDTWREWMSGLRACRGGGHDDGVRHRDRDHGRHGLPGVYTPGGTWASAPTARQSARRRPRRRRHAARPASPATQRLHQRRVLRRLGLHSRRPVSRRAGDRRASATSARAPASPASALASAGGGHRPGHCYGGAARSCCASRRSRSRRGRSFSTVVFLEDTDTSGVARPWRQATGKRRGRCEARQPIPGAELKLRHQFDAGRRIVDLRRADWRWRWRRWAPRSSRRAAQKLVDDEASVPPVAERGRRRPR
ncbi:MAG: hypothetical protein MZW92_14120, partial [Comamonadaceae bacterium]|nr:hypothetical protein [Comamonadaceae bacterium]